MCDHVNREAAMVVIDPGTAERHGRDGIWCDPCLEPLIRALNDGGIRTVASCCGHYKRSGSICLAGGRELIIHTQDRSHEGEHCFDCGRSYDHVIWTAPDDLWQQLTGWGEGGLLCPDCFGRRAFAVGIFLRFVPHVEATP